MARRDDEFVREHDRAARKLQRRLDRIDRRLERVRRILVEIIDETALVERRLAILWGDQDLDDAESGGAVVAEPPLPASVESAGPEQPAPDAPSAPDAPPADPETPWKRGVQDLAALRAQQLPDPTPPPASSAGENMERFLAGTPPPHATWPQIDRERTW